MSAKQIEIANAIVSLLNSADFGTAYESFTAYRAYIPSFELKELDSLQVVVVAGPQSTERISRGEWSGNFTTYVGVLRRVGVDKDDADIGEFDALQEHVEAMTRVIKSNPIGVAGTSLRAVSAGRGDVQADALPFLIEHLQNKHTFTSVISVVHFVTQLL